MMTESLDGGNWMINTEEMVIKANYFSYKECDKNQGWDSQNFLRQILKIFITSKWFWEPTTQMKKTFYTLYCS